MIGTLGDEPGFDLALEQKVCLYSYKARSYSRLVDVAAILNIISWTRCINSLYPPGGGLQRRLIHHCQREHVPSLIIGLERCLSEEEIPRTFGSRCCISPCPSLTSG